MKLLAWNLGHQCREDAISGSFIEAIKQLQPDVLSLNEYVHGESRTQLVSDLATLGLTYISLSERLNGNNQILIASKYPMIAGDLTGPASIDKASESNFLHVLIPSINLEFVGVRAPAYVGNSLKNYWLSLVDIIQSCRSRNIVFMGDFNTDPEQPKRSTAKYLKSLMNEGWQVPHAHGEWSYISPKGIGTRIDHAVVSDGIAVSRADYIASLDDFELASNNRLLRVSDHAPLLLVLKRYSN